MKLLVENARRAAEVAKEEIAKVKARFAFGDSGFDIADDAYLGAGWTAQRLKDLEAIISQPPDA